MCISRNRLVRQRKRYHAKAPWLRDSGGFTEIARFGRWTVPIEQFIDETRDDQERIGSLRIASPQDWMCEPAMLKRSGLTVEDHQRRTVDNFCALRSMAPDVPWMPVLQGWTIDQYVHCMEMYGHAGINLWDEPTVGVGSICRRQATADAHEIIRLFSDGGLRLHAFGFKTDGLIECADSLVSADSMAWSYLARHDAALSECKHATCAGCDRYAMIWYNDLIETISAV